MGMKGWLGLAIIMNLWATSLAVAADWSLVPSISQRAEYNNNINTTSNGQLGDFIFTTNPSAAFSYATEAANLQGTLGISQLLYVKNTGYDHTDQNYQINGQYSLTPRFNASLTSSFISDSTSQQEFLTSGLTIIRTPRLSFAVGPGISYSLTERLSATLSYNFNKVTYQPLQTTQSQNFPNFPNSPNSQNYQDFSSQLVSLMWQYLLSEKTTISTTFSGTETTYASSNGNDYKSLLGTLGVNHNFSEQWKFNVAGGVNYSSYTNNSQIASAGQFPNFVSVPTQKQNNANFSPYFNLSATRIWTKLSISGSLSRNQSASAFGYISQVNALSLNANYQFTERLTGSLGGGYSLSSQSSTPSQNQTNGFNVGAQLSYLITERLIGSSGYTFSFQSYGGNNLSPSRNAPAQVVWLMLNYSYPLHYMR